MRHLLVGHDTLVARHHPAQHPAPQVGQEVELGQGAHRHGVIPEDPRRVGQPGGVLVQLGSEGERDYNSPVPANLWGISDPISVFSITRRTSWGNCSSKCYHLLEIFCFTYFLQKKDFQMN